MDGVGELELEQVAGGMHTPVAGTQVPSNPQSVGHDLGSDPTHVPDWQRSVKVHKSPSSQA